MMQQLDAAHPGHADVGEDEIDRGCGERTERRVRALGGRDREVALAQEELQDAPDVRVVLDHEHPMSVVHAHVPPRC